MKALKITGKILVLFAIIFTVVSCISPTPVIQVYSGPKLPREQVAIVTMDSTLGVVNVNRVDPNPATTMRTMTLEVLPGKYNIRLFYDDGYQSSVDDLDVMLLAEAGKSYHIYAGAGGGSWDPYVLQK